MRQARLKVDSRAGRAVYHCVSRIVDRRFIFEELEKETFVQFLREYEQFCGVEVLTYCLMSNHFHILVEVPQRPTELPSAQEVVRRLKGLSGAAVSAATVEQRLDELVRAGHEAGVAALLEPYYRRMWDVSQFVKLLKQRFSQWYNRRKERKGTLWEDRFQSVLVEGGGDALLTMASYIELNPVRAGLVRDPGQYRWSGYGEAVAGRERAREGIRRIYGLSVHQEEVSVTEALRGYRMRVFTQGEAGREGTDAAGQALRPGISREEVLKVVGRKGRLGLEEYLQCRVRYFSDGLILGNREFVEGTFQQFRSHFSRTRKNGARRMRGLLPPLFTARDLRKKVFG